MIPLKDRVCFPTLLSTSTLGVDSGARLNSSARIEYADPVIPGTFVALLTALPNLSIHGWGDGPCVIYWRNFAFDTHDERGERTPAPHVIIITPDHRNRIE